MALTAEQEERLNVLLQGLEPMSKELPSRSRDFVADQIKRHDEYGSNMRVSPAQLKWLEDLYAKHVGELPEDTYEAEGGQTDLDDEIPF